jgi:hypothetical protein
MIALTHDVEHVKIAPLDPPAPVKGKAKLMAAVAQRYGKAYLESERLFAELKEDRHNESLLRRYARSLRRLETLRQMERDLAA